MLPWHFWLFISIIGLVIAFVDWKVRKALAMPKIPEPFNLTIKLMGGPFHEKQFTTPVLKRPDFFIQPYVPEEPDEEKRIAKVEKYQNGEPVGVQEMYEPNWAYYRFVMDDTYFYVRDVDIEEVERLGQTGELPDVKP